MSNLGDAIDGLVTVVTANVEGAHVYNHPPDLQTLEYPAVVVTLDELEPDVAFSGNSFEFDLRLTILYAAQPSDEAFQAVYNGIDPTDPLSIIGAIRTDPTLDGKVDDSNVRTIENIGKRQMPDSSYAGFDAVIHIIKSVA